MKGITEHGPTRLAFILTNDHLLRTHKTKHLIKPFNYYIDK